MEVRLYSQIPIRPEKCLLLLGDAWRPIDLQVFLKQSSVSLSIKRGNFVRL